MQTKITIPFPLNPWRKDQKRESKRSVQKFTEKTVKKVTNCSYL